MAEAVASRPWVAKVSTLMVRVVVYAAAQVENWAVMALKREEDLMYEVIPVVAKEGVKAHDPQQVVVAAKVQAPVSMVVRGAVKVVSISVQVGWKAVGVRWGRVELAVASEVVGEAAEIVVVEVEAVYRKEVVQSVGEVGEVP